MPQSNKRKFAASAAEVERERRMHGGGLAAYWGPRPHLSLPPPPPPPPLPPPLLAPRPPRAGPPPRVPPPPHPCSWVGRPPIFADPAAAARAWPVGPVAALPRPDPWPMRGETTTARELWQLDSAVARDFLIKVAEGYSYQTGIVRPAVFGPKGCWVSQLASDLKNGYGHGRPPVPGTNGAKPMKQKLHRMAILAWHDATSFQLLMFRQSAGDDGRYEASHLCKNARCFRPDHLVVEEHSVNEGRKRCVAGQCRHNPPYTCV